MLVGIKCPHCWRVMDVDKSMIDTDTKCTHCERGIHVSLDLVQPDEPVGGQRVGPVNLGEEVRKLRTLLLLILTFYVVGGILLPLASDRAADADALQQAITEQGTGIREAVEKNGGLLESLSMSAHQTWVSDRASAEEIAAIRHQMEALSSKMDEHARLLETLGRIEEALQRIEAREKKPTSDSSGSGPGGS